MSATAARFRFLREARAAARLRHSNVASVLYLGRIESGYFYAMEFVEGETLENLELKYVNDSFQVKKNKTPGRSGGYFVDQGRNRRLSGNRLNIGHAFFTGAKG